MVKTNPFIGNDADREQIWHMLVSRDIKAYCDADWSQVADDFIEGEFYAVNSNTNPDPGTWNLAFSTLGQYRDEWLKQAELTNKQNTQSH